MPVVAPAEHAKLPVSSVVVDRNEVSADIDGSCSVFDTSEGPMSQVADIAWTEDLEF